MSIFKQYVKEFVETNTTPVVKEATVNEEVLDEAWNVYTKQEIAGALEDTITTEEKENLGYYVFVKDTTSSSDGDRVTQYYSIKDAEDDKVLITKARYLKVKRELESKYDVKKGGDLQFLQTPGEICYTYSKIKDTGEDYTVLNDPEALPYLTYKLIKDNLGPYKKSRDKSRPYEKSNEITTGLIASISRKLNEKGIGFAALSDKDVEQLMKLEQKIESDIRKGKRRAPFQTWKREDINKLKNEVIQYLMGVFSVKDASIMEYLPEDWPESKKLEWAKIRISKYIASTIPIHPWRVILRTGKPETDVGIHYLNDGSGDFCGWCFFREKEDAEQALATFLQKNVDRDDVRTAYLKNSRIVQDKQMCEEAFALVSKLIEKGYINQWLKPWKPQTSEDSDQVKSEPESNDPDIRLFGPYVEDHYKDPIEKEYNIEFGENDTYNAKNLQHFLSLHVNPIIKQEANDIRKMYYTIYERDRRNAINNFNKPASNKAGEKND